MIARKKILVKKIIISFSDDNLCNTYFESVKFLLAQMHQQRQAVTTTDVSRNVVQKTEESIIYWTRQQRVTILKVTKALYLVL